MIRLGLAGRVPVRGPAAAGRLDSPGRGGGVRDRLQAGPGGKTGQVRGHLRRALDDLAKERFPFQHPRAHCWIRRAGSKFRVYICTYEVPGGGRAHREQIVRELTAIYQPRCNEQQFDQAWKDEWIAARPLLPRPGQGPARPEGTS